MGMKTERKEEPAALPTVDRSEVRKSFARSSGPGGQNVNKLNTKAVLHWSVGEARGFDEEQKALIRAYAGNRLTKADEVTIYDQSTRSQGTNLERAYERLDEFVLFALTPEKERKATKVPRASKENRLREKDHEAKKKAARRVDRNEW